MKTPPIKAAIVHGGRLGAALILLCLVPAAASPALPLVAAHRGITGPGQVENSLDAIRRASAAGVEAIEIDLRSTSDGALVLFHDTYIDRPANDTAAVERLTLADLTLAPTKEGAARIATFAEALDLTAGPATRLLLDLKRPGAIAPARIIEMATRHGALDRIIIGARTATEVRAYRQLAPSLPILGFVRSQADIDAFIEAGATIIRLWPRWIFTPASGCSKGGSPSCVVQRLQRRGLNVWVLADAPSRDDEAQLCFAALAGLELDGILTNRPVLAREILVSSARSPKRFPGRRRCTW